MGHRHHVKMCIAFEEKFPALFNFESCGLLFCDSVDGSLFKIAINKV